MVQYPEQRDDARLNYKSPVKVEDLVSGVTLGAFGVRRYPWSKDA
jgi:hypothetical protein